MYREIRSYANSIWDDNNNNNNVYRKLLTRSFETAVVGIGTLLVMEQSSLESQSRGCAKTPILTVSGTLGPGYTLYYVDVRRV